MAGRDPAAGSLPSVPTLIFSHANGFPAGTYEALFERWRAAGWRVLAIERLGHDPAYPVTSNWPRLNDQLCELIDREMAAFGPVHLVGHSLGGFLSVMAASQRPAAVQGVVLLDSPIIAGWKAHALHLAKSTGVIHRVSPGKVARRRRHEWPDVAAVHRHFQSKATFARWDPRVLADYVRTGFDPVPGESRSRRLGFQRDIETRIYDTLPHHIPNLLRRHPLQCRVAFLGGTQSAEVRLVGLSATRRLTHDRIGWVEGSHLFPMEKPAETADAVLGCLHAFERSG